jgi:hypothetical protein
MTLADGVGILGLVIAFTFLLFVVAHSERLVLTGPPGKDMCHVASKQT